jgi:perosamine synthetase
MLGPAVVSQHEGATIAMLQALKASAPPVCLPTADPRVTLVVLTADLSAALIVKLATWRRRAADGFTSLFEVTEEGTRAWAGRLHARSDRVLFLVRYDGVPAGQLGLSEFDFATRSCEVWDVIRGDPSAPRGMMGVALAALLQWTYDVLGVATIRLRVLADATRAIALYHRAGFVAERLVPLHRVVEPRLTRWEPCGSADPIDRFTVQMRHVR